MNLSRFFRMGLVALLASVPVLAWPQMGGPALVKTAEAVVKDIAPVTRVAGTVVSRNDARLSAEVTGRLPSVADVGTEVKAGEPVARIEDTALRLRNAELAAQVTRAEARLRFLEGEEQRFSQLAADNLAAVTQLELTRSDRDVARGDLDIAKARLEQNRDQLIRTEILAPYSGIVVERLMTPGERVEEGGEVVRLVDQQHLEVIARAPLDYFSFIQPGQSVALSAGNVQSMGVVRRVIAGFQGSIDRTQGCARFTP
jgi:RND family efflux transporter MFP subunit